MAVVLYEGCGQQKSSGPLASKPLARIGIANGRDEERQTKGQHDHVQHGASPGRASSLFEIGAGGEKRIAVGRCEMPRCLRIGSSVAIKCHQAHRFSRRTEWRRYMNLIKV